MTDQEREKYFDSFLKLKNELEYAKMALSSPAGIVQNEMEISEEMLDTWKEIANSTYKRLDKIFKNTLKQYKELCTKIHKEIKNDVPRK